MSYPPTRYASYASRGGGSLSRPISTAGRGQRGGFENIPLGNPSGSSGPGPRPPPPPWITPGTRPTDMPPTANPLHPGPTGFPAGQGGGGMGGGSHHWYPGHPANEPGDWTCLGKIHCWIWLILVCILIGGSIAVGVVVGGNND